MFTLFSSIIHTQLKGLPNCFMNTFRLQGMPTSIVCDKDKTFTGYFWKELFQMQGSTFNFSSSYHPQTESQTEVTNRKRCFTSDKPKEWMKWMVCAEYCYNTNFHTAVKMTPFQALYGIPPPSLLTFLASTAKSTDLDTHSIISIDSRKSEVYEHI